MMRSVVLPARRGRGIIAMPPRRHRRTGAQRRDPAIHCLREKMDARVKPAQDDGEGVSRIFKCAG
jgi:hypothetical protein